MQQIVASGADFVVGDDGAAEHLDVKEEERGDERIVLAKQFLQNGDDALLLRRVPRIELQKGVGRDLAHKRHAVHNALLNRHQLQLPDLRNANRGHDTECQSTNTLRVTAQRTPLQGSFLPYPAGTC